MLMYSLIPGLVPENEQKRPQTDETSPEILLDFPCQTTVFPPNFLGRRIHLCLNSSPSSSLLDEDIIEVLKYSFYKSYVKLTSDLLLVVCTCSLQVGLL